MKYVPISKGKFAIVDDEDYLKVSGISWFLDHRYAVHRYYENGRKGKRFDLRMQKLILNTNQSIDHINGNGLDNRKSNLRICTQSQNSKNHRTNKNNTSGFKGVTKSASLLKPWQVQIWNNWEKIYGGCYKTKEEAALAYNRLAIKYHGEFARLNKI